MCCRATALTGLSWSPVSRARPWAQLPPEQQQALEAENQALVNELSSLNQSARGIESTMRELAQLSQMFSAQVMHQAEQIEQLYQQVGCSSLLVLYRNSDKLITHASKYTHRSSNLHSQSAQASVHQPALTQQH